MKINEKKSFLTAVAALVLLLICNTSQLAAKPFEISWFTVDSGGGFSSGGTFELNGTVGQHDPGPVMTGGSFTLAGGFWVGDDGSILLGDVNGDGVVNLLDVAPFVDAIANGIYIPEADINTDGFVNLLDVELFVELLSG